MMVVGFCASIAAEVDARTVNGKRGADSLRGTPGADTLVGRTGNDQLLGRSGNDRLIGGPGHDRLFGGPGRDRLVGGPGADRLSGGPGPDRFACGRGRDVVTVDVSDRVAGDCEKLRTPGAPKQETPQPAGGTSQPTSPAGGASSVTFEGTIKGTTYSFNGNAGAYLPVENFSRPATVVIEPHPTRGSSSRAVGIFSGDPLAVAQAGSTWLATHTAVYRLLPACKSYAAAGLDLAAVTVNEAAGEITAGVLGGTTSFFARCNIFHTQTWQPPLGAFAGINQGGLRLKLGDGGSTLSGLVEVYGNKHIEPGNTFPVEAVQFTIEASRTG
jgi:hypothetical protein